MFTTQDYIYGWMLYIFGGLVFFGCWWYLTAKIQTVAIRSLLRTLCLVVMFVPWYADPELGYLAPAVVIAGIEGLFDGNFWRAGAPLITGIVLGVLSSLGYALVRRMRAKKSKEAGAPRQDTPVSTPGHS